MQIQFTIHKKPFISNKICTISFYIFFQTYDLFVASAYEAERLVSVFCAELGRVDVSKL